MTVVGTVGHIDHGKTALLRALTGIDADRLPEERRRGITIDLGYAYLPLPNAGSLDFVDLPGHHALADNFLVGAGEIDAALLVVAADAGPEAQTFEHLDVLAALGLRLGVVAVTKIDLVGLARRAAVLGDVETLLEGSALGAAPVIPVSARTAEGIDRLRAALIALDVAASSAPNVAGAPSYARLAVDRAFRVVGHGLVATGSLRGRDLAVGAELRVVPGNSTVRVRRVQVHGEDVPSAVPGSRVAVNVAGRETGHVRRGAVLTSGAGVVASDRLLVMLERTAATSAPSRLNVMLHVGTEHAPGVLSRLEGGGPEADRGQAHYALLHLDRAVAAAIADRFVLRVPSPPRVLGGGTVVDPAPPRVRGRTLRDRLRSLPASPPLTTLLGYRRAMTLTEFAKSADALGLEFASPADVVSGAMQLGALVLAPGVDDELAGDATSRVSEAGARGISASQLGHDLSRIVMQLGGIGREEAAAAALALVERMAATGLLELRGELAVDTTVAAVRDGLAAAEQTLLDALDTPRPAALADAARAASYPSEALSALFASGRLVRVAPNLAFSAEAYGRLERLALSMADRGELSAAAFRDAARTSRRHAVAVLDAMALAGVIRRVGNRHELAPRGRDRLTSRDRDPVAAHGGCR